MGNVEDTTSAGIGTNERWENEGKGSHEPGNNISILLDDNSRVLPEGLDRHIEKGASPKRWVGTISQEARIINYHPRPD